MRSKRSRLDSFSSYLSEWSHGLSKEEQNLLKRDRAVRRIQDQFATLVSPYVLEHVNAVYLLSPESSSRRSNAEGVSRGTAYAPLSLEPEGASPCGSDEGKRLNPLGPSKDKPSVGSPSLKKKKLVVYVDSSLVSAELNAQRELIRLRYLTDFSVELVGFDIKLSRGGYLNKHPYRDRKDAEREPEVSVSRETLSAEDLSYIDKVSSSIEDDRLRETFKKAMTASFVKNRKNSEKDSRKGLR